MQDNSQHHKVSVYNMHPYPQARTGIVMNIIGILCITLAINTWGKAMFDLDSFPTWANVTGV